MASTTLSFSTSPLHLPLIPSDRSQTLCLLSPKTRMKLEDLLVEEENKEHHTTRDDDRHEQEVISKAESSPTRLEDILIEEDKNARIKNKKKKRTLQKEVTKLQGELEDEQALNKALRAMLRGPVLSQPRLSLLLLPPQVQDLVEELATVEAEILCLEKKVQELKVEVYNEKKETDEREAEALLSKEEEEQHQMVCSKRLQRQNHLPCETRNDLPMKNSDLSIRDDRKPRSKSQSFEHVVKETKTKGPRTISIGSTAEFTRINPSSSPDRHRNKPQVLQESKKESPNGISEELIKCLISLYLELNRMSREKEGLTTVSKLSLSHLKSASFKRKSVYDHNASNLDPYGVVTGSSVRDVGPYKNFIHITRSSIDVSRLSDCSTEIVNLRVLIEKLNKVDLTFLSHKKKLAFWINTYNACAMNAFLEHGLPSSQEKLLTILNKATINVGGFTLSAPEIERFILQNPCQQQEFALEDEKESKLQKLFGLGYPEPNLAFVLCRGNWSSPALRVYTPEEVVNELIRARTEYLEASVGISSRKKIVIPRLLHSRLRDFAEDEELLLEWICTQLPPLQRCLPLKETMIECLKHKMSIPMTQIIEIQHCEYEFRYLLPL